jgi:hypothetical protein
MERECSGLLNHQCMWPKQHVSGGYMHIKKYKCRKKLSEINITSDTPEIEV